MEEKEFIEDASGCGCQCECGDQDPCDCSCDAEQVDKITEMGTLVGELQDKNLRLQAEFDNYRRRTLKERDELISRATEEVVCKLLPIIDSFERGILSSDNDTEAIAKGFELIHRQFAEFLNKSGIEEIPACGCDFDPSLHNAVMRVDSAEHDDNTVVEAMQKGYTLRGRVIRPSMVKVCAK